MPDKDVSFEELIVSTGGYGVSNIKMCPGNAVIDKTLMEAALRQQDITVLAIERDQKVIPNPAPDMKICAEDHLICFGQLERIRQTLCPQETV